VLLTPEQREAVTRTHDSLCVVAGAGTGKTRVLIARYLELLDSGLASPGEIAAITFTDKAAAGMVVRLRSECRRRADEAGDATERQLWRDRRDQLAAGTIATIHSFCQGLVRRYPVEAGVDPMFSLVTGVAQQQLAKGAVLGSIRRLLEADDASLHAVVRAYGLGALRTMLASALKRRAAVMPAIAALQKSPSELLAALQAEVEATTDLEIKQLLASHSRPSGLIRAVRGADGDLAENARLQAAEALAMLTGGKTVGERLDGLRALGDIRLSGGSKKAWASGEMLAEVKDALKAVREAARMILTSCDVTDPSEWPAEIELLQHLTRVVAATFEDYESAKRAEGLLDFDDLLLKARDLLAAYPDTCKELSRKYRHVLVDELQDTDPLQVEVVCLLLGTERGKAFCPPAGSFFGVGDPKQSIYRFRGADVEVFRQIAASLPGDSVIPLTRTFRFHQGLADVTNTVFEPLLGDDFVAMDSAREDAPPEISAEVLLATCDPGDSAHERRTHEAARIARRIRDLVDTGGVAYRDIAILMHRQTQSYPYEEAMAALGIPVYVVGGRRFYEQEEIRDAVTALRVIRNPGNLLALASWLRGPLVGVSDEALVHLCRDGDLHETLFDDSALAALLPSDVAKVQRGCRWLEAFTGRAGRVGIGQLIEEIAFTGLPDTDGRNDLPTLAHVLLPSFLGERRYGNLRRLLEKARAFDLAGGTRLEDFLESVETGIEEGMEESEASLASETADCVLLMTVHKAKGLEFPYVILANTDAARPISRPPFRVSSAFGVVGRRPDRQLGGSVPALYTVMQAREVASETEEFKRLFYVAATRARERLIVSGSQKISRDSWLQWLGESLTCSLDEEPAGCREITVHACGNIVIDVGQAEPVPQGGGAWRGKVASLFADGLVDGAVLGEFRARPVAKTVREEVAHGMATVAPEALPLRLSATAIADYAQCPARYYLRRVVGLQDVPPPGGGSAAGAVAANVIGDLVHHYLRDVDLSRQAVDENLLGILVRQESRIPANHRPEATSRVNGLVNSYHGMALSAELREARQVLREVPFVLDMQGVTITGVIDLLYQDSEGRWSIVDYKTDAIDAKDADNHAEAYRDQLNVYRVAAQDFLQESLRDTCLAFLRPGIMWYMNGESARAAVASVCERIRFRQFDPRDDCTEACAYHRWCKQHRGVSG
jgi:ATP-dependent helicase/nuclease subunit A